MGMRRPEPGSVEETFSHRGLRLAFGLTMAGASLLAGCSSSSSAPEHNGVVFGGTVVKVVAAENFWGSIAAQIGGKHAQVTSIITNPDTDPHSYEPTPSDARALAGAQMVIENGIGYDPWVTQLLSADQPHPMVLDVGDVLGLSNSANPHRWYNPADVQRVMNRIVADLQSLDPTDGAYFGQQKSAFDTDALAQYHAAIASIRAKYYGTPVGASESIFAMLAPALGLKLITPYSFLRDISEGTEVSAADKETIDKQIKDHEIKIYVYNSQNVTPDIRAQLDEVRAEHIPYVAITETLSPSDASYQVWQTKQLLGIEAALGKAARGAR